MGNYSTTMLSSVLDDGYIIPKIHLNLRYKFHIKTHGPQVLREMHVHISIK